MKKIIGGAIAASIGLYGISIFYTSMYSVLIGVIPIILLISGCLIVYLKYKDLYSGEKLSDDQNLMDFSETISTSAESEELETKSAESEESETKPAELEEAETITAEPEEEMVEGESTIIESKGDEDMEKKSVESEPEETKSTSGNSDRFIGESQPLVGNTGSLVFHNPGCQYSKSKKCTAAFNTREVAITEGYKPCGVCKP